MQWKLLLVACLATACSDGCSRAAPITARAVPAEFRDHTAAESLTLLVFGDSGTGTDKQFAVANAMHAKCQQVGCDLAIVNGDLIYEFGVDDIDDEAFDEQFEQPYAKFGRFDFWMVAGNHDWRGNVAAQVAYTRRSQRWRMPAYHYRVPGLPDWLTLYGLDTSKMNAKQVEEARKEVCKTTDGWRFVFGHHPIYSNGYHGDDDDLDLEKLLLPMIKDCGVQIFFAGHDHNQEHLTMTDFEQVIQGAAAKRRRVKTKPYVQGSGRRQNFITNKNGFAVVELSPAALTMTFYDVEGAQLYAWTTTPDAVGLR